jgi:hypothetical protein
MLRYRKVNLVDVPWWEEFLLLVGVVTTGLAFVGGFALYLHHHYGVPLPHNIVAWVLLVGGIATTVYVLKISHKRGIL